MTEYQQLPIVRIVIDPALREGAPVTIVDLRNIFQGILISFPDAFGQGVVGEDLVHLTDEEREKFRIAEDENFEATENTSGLRHVFIFDAYQLAPHLRCPVSSLPALLGARGIMDVLLDEARCCVDVVCALLAKGIPGPGIAIVVYYKDQQHILQSNTRRSGVALPHAYRRHGPRR
ncbi:unnamed protein product [Haemonchus placei]|uniref:AAA_12 domain-containing protein n=1 Tax=Haemonchus placei TaxID=6290 RepID=A0A0N4WCW8_HAEPC|nr:unnamed protein product [Haemonchus placei]